MVSANDRTAHDIGSEGVAERPLSSATAKLPLSTELLGLCDYGNTALWGRSWGLDGAEAHLPLPSLGRPGLRPGTVRI